MSLASCEFNHGFGSVSEIRDKLRQMGADYAILKVLPKNANDKNQIYVASDFRVLHPTFAMQFQDRGVSTSVTKGRSVPGKHIPEAVFSKFDWLRADNSLVAAKSVRAIIYAQYPEARLSGFQTIENTMPRALSVEYTKENPDSKRLLIIGRGSSGRALGIMVGTPGAQLLEEVKSLPGVYGSKVCKEIRLDLGRSLRLENDLRQILGNTFDGKRLDKHGNSLPFNGTQVCGYTLEHELGIRPNSDQHGDLYGIELKVHTMPKVTLFTPEPDFGLYSDDFPAYMIKYGYRDGNDDLRVTGIHRAGIRCAKSGLTLKVRTSALNEESGKVEYSDYDASRSFTSQMDSIEVVLLDDEGSVAAGWSLERILNNWNNKHDEVVYVSAKKTVQTDLGKIDGGIKHLVRFEKEVTWCKKTSAVQLFNAISQGVIYLDPAPKYCPDEPSRNKRRSQWRVSNIDKAVKTLYEEVRYVTIE